MTSLWPLLLTVLVLHRVSSAQYSVGVTEVNVNGPEVKLAVKGPSGKSLIQGNLGLTLPNDVTHTECASKNGGACISFSNGWTLNVEEHPTISQCSRIIWQADTLIGALQECFTLVEPDDVHMYGGGEQAVQHWAIEGYDRPLTPVVSEDNAIGFGGLVERYWLFSNGMLINHDWDTPLWFNLTASTRSFCFTSMNVHPYNLNENDISSLQMKYTTCSSNNVLDVHKLWITENDIKPQGVPDQRMIVYPDWSTWAPFKSDINTSAVLQFANDILGNGFPISQLEIDDRWQTCYGEQVVDTTRFSNMSGLISTLHDLGMRVTAWVHPFINNDCPSYQTVADQSYLVLNSSGQVGPVTWWDSSTDQSALFDFTNDEASEWWYNRLSTLQTTYGFDSFKFDAGETYWLPTNYVLNSNINTTLWPIAFTQSYVETLSRFGDMVECRSGSQTYKYNIFVRFLDKDSLWTYDNGLLTMIPSALFFGIVGYVHVLPDMVGGNAYSGEYPDSELFIRWVQSNVFFPSIQFSLPPWSYDNTTTTIVRDMLNIRTSYGDYIISLFEEANMTGYPIVRPLWWIAPEDSNTFAVDSEYVLGNDLLVAPVLVEGATSRDIYFPEGTWYDVNNGVNITGPTNVTGYSADIDVLPYFIRANNSQLMEIAVPQYLAKANSKSNRKSFQKIKPKI
jgi:alpha-glucosidase